MRIKMQSEYQNNKEPYTLCPNCEAHWYHDDIDADAQHLFDLYEDEKGENEDGCDMFCQNCGEYFDSDYPGKVDPTESEVEAMYKELFSECEWALMTPTDKRCGYVDYTDGLDRDGTISNLMAISMGGHSEG